jgi:hypothetical protein
VLAILQVSRFATASPYERLPPARYPSAASSEPDGGLAKRRALYLPLFVESGRPVGPVEHCDLQRQPPRHLVPLVAVWEAGLD